MYENQTDTEPETVTDSEEMARQRAQTCAEEVAKVCERFRCRLVAYTLPPENVGNTSERIQIQASYGFIPEL